MNNNQYDHARPLASLSRWLSADDQYEHGVATDLFSQEIRRRGQDLATRNSATAACSPLQCQRLRTPSKLTDAPMEGEPK